MTETAVNHFDQNSQLQIESIKDSINETANNEQKSPEAEPVCKNQEIIEDLERQIADVMREAEDGTS